MTVTQTGNSRQTTTRDTKAGGVVAALASQETFTRAQVAWLMSEAMRWGYEARDEEDRGFWAGYNARVAEENAAYPPPKVFTLGRWFDQATERQKADAAARLPRPGDFKGQSAPTHDAQVAA